MDLTRSAGPERPGHSYPRPHAPLARRVARSAAREPSSEQVRASLRTRGDSDTALEWLWKGASSGLVGTLG